MKRHIVTTMYNNENKCTPNQWIVCFTRSDWFLKLGILSAIQLPAFCWISHASFPSFLRKKEVFAAGYPLVWYVLKQLFTLLSVKSGRYLPDRFAANIHHYSPFLR